MSSHTAQPAPAGVGATGNKDVFGRTFADTRDVFMTEPQKSHTIISAVLWGPKQLPTSTHVQREETSTLPLCGRSISVVVSESTRDARHSGHRVWKIPAAGRYPGKVSRSKAESIAWLGTTAQCMWGRVTCPSGFPPGNPWLSDLQREEVFSGSPDCTSWSHFYFARPKSHEQGRRVWVHQ